MQPQKLRFALCASILSFYSIQGLAAELEQPGLQQLAVESVMESQRVSAEEAARRLQLQDRAAGIEDRIEAVLGRDYAGLWYDHADRGRLEIGLTRAGSARAADVQRIVDEYGLGEDAALVNVRFSIEEIESRKADIRESLIDMMRAGRAMTGYDTQANSVVVITLANLSAAEESRIRALAAQEGVIVRREDVAALGAQPLSCNTVYCNAPMRGGRRIQWCTGGFTARHRVHTNDKLILTAGHCVAWNWSNPWKAYNLAGVLKDIGPSYGYVIGGMDAGAIKLAPGNYWNSFVAPKPEVIVMASDQTTYDEHYEIQHDSASTMGATLCYSGGMSYTHCGPVAILGLDYFDVLIGSMLTNMGGIGFPQTCWPEGGDSGAPMYKIHRGYGLLVSRFFLEDGCLGVYQGIRAAENAMNVDILLSP